MPQHYDESPSTGSWEDCVQAFWRSADLTDRAASVKAMEALADERPPDDPAARFEMGCVYDPTGYEQQAAAEYQAARNLGLSGARLARLNIQQGSTLRNVGRLDEAITMLEAAEPHPEIGQARAVFLALALHDAGRHAEALRVALGAVIPDLPRYRQSAAAYAQALTDDSAKDGMDE
ncbi:tetratricopeptide repeat protein [Kocuria sp.]|uniref:tetratricopeptide repeat protein n=1 Tax=Kocuria sp. TaxID=1871328 RepID=UPI0026DF37F1|nr:tetratricopeptide repeat protein [Kocuria sp.]MDO5619431.1 tetratricopeptide repeat protein [Kocuria sp.]